jgi:hypothetical protein
MPWLGTISLESAALDVVGIMENRHLPLYDKAFGASPDYWKSVSPIHRLTGKPGPMLLVCSTRRRLPCEHAESFAAAARERGGKASVLRMPLSHRAINVELGEPGSYTAEVDGFLRTLGLP